MIFYRRLSQFFKDHYPDIKLASELEKELAIRSLVNSGSFSNTHNAIVKLKKYAEFNKSQINELVQACLTNDQVGWIITDGDVKKFYKSLLDNHGEDIEDELKEKLKIELNLDSSDEESA